MSIRYRAEIGVVIIGWVNNGQMNIETDGSREVANAALDTLSREA